MAEEEAGPSVQGRPRAEGKPEPFACLVDLPWSSPAEVVTSSEHKSLLVATMSKPAAGILGYLGPEHPIAGFHPSLACTLFGLLEDGLDL
jgi:hypothetical protein